MEEKEALNRKYQIPDNIKIRIFRNPKLRQLGFIYSILKFLSARLSAVRQNSRLKIGKPIIQPFMSLPPNPTST
jgi:hypothetical protein